MLYLGPVGQVPTVGEEEFQKWALFRDDADLTPKELEKFYEATLEREEDIDTTLDESYGTVVGDLHPEVSKYHLLPGHELYIEVQPGEDLYWSIDPNDQTINSDERDTGDKAIGEFDTLQQAIKAAEKDAIKRRDAWSKSRYKRAPNWVKEKAKQVNPKWLEELEEEQRRQRESR
jgi:hypothetical protein